MIGLDLVGLVAGEERGVHRLHTAGTRETAHQPVVDARHVVSVHAWKIAYGVAAHKLHHADHALTMAGLLAVAVITITSCASIVGVRASG